MSPVRSPSVAIPSYKNSIHFLWKNVLLFLSSNRPAQLFHDRSQVKYQMLQLNNWLQGSSEQNCFFLSQAAASLLGSWLGSPTLPRTPFFGSQHKYGSFSSFRL